MIVFYGMHDDPPIVRAIEAAQERKLPYIALDMNALHRADFAIELGGGRHGRLFASGSEIAFEQISGIYARPLELSQRWPDALARMRAEAFHELFVEWLDFVQVPVVNRPCAMESNASKPFQAQIIGGSGFAVPETLVTSAPDEARDFWRRHGRVIFKSVSGVRSIVQELSEKTVRRLDCIKDLPTQFQAYVAGVDIRVHVVGERVFATQIQSNATDYRYAHRDAMDVELTSVPLPDAIASRCTRLAALLDLPFCGIDLRRTPQGEYVCFEVNPMPAYSYYEAHTDVSISGALVELLAGNAASSGGDVHGPSH